jgi:hypothetical protein
MRYSAQLGWLESTHMVRPISRSRQQDRCVGGSIAWVTGTPPKWSASRRSLSEILRKAPHTSHTRSFWFTSWTCTPPPAVGWPHGHTHTYTHVLGSP